MAATAPRQQSFRMQTPGTDAARPPQLASAPTLKPSTSEPPSSPTGSRALLSLPSPAGMTIPLYAQPAQPRPAVYRLEESGRTFILYSRDLHCSHAPLKDRGQHAMAPGHASPPPAIGGWSQPPLRMSRALSEPRPLGSVLRRTVWPEVLTEPPDPPPPVIFGYPPSVDDALRRSIPPPKEPPPPPPTQKGLHRGKPRRKSSPPRTRPPPDHRAEQLPLPKLLQDVAASAAGEDAKKYAKHNQVLLNLFAQHELAMEVASANLDKKRAKPAGPPSCAMAASQAGATMNKANIAREEMAMRRKLILRPQSLTFN